MRTPIASIAAVIPHYRNPGPLAAKDRFVSGIAGASLLISGWRRGGFGGFVLAAVGADLLYRGFHGGGHVYQMVTDRHQEQHELSNSSE